MSKPVLRDRDSAETVFRLRSFAWSLAGLVLGALLGELYALTAGRRPLPHVIGFGLFVWAVVFFGTLFLSERAGRALSSIYFSSGSSTPARREYSLAESLVARGQLSEAVSEYERNAAANPDDAEPCLRLARLYRDALRQPEPAAGWFRRALAVPALDAGLALLARRELIELYLHHLRQPRRALPELARLAELHAASPHGDWARRELASLKQILRNEENDHG